MNAWAGFLLGGRSGSRLAAFLLSISASSLWAAETHELIVRYKKLETVEALVATLNEPFATDRQIARARLGNPLAARTALPDRLSDEDRTRAHPALKRLQDYLVLIYPGSVEASAALSLLKTDDTIASVERNTLMPSSAVEISDTLYPVSPAPPAAPNITRYQWHLRTLDFETLWARHRGHGYVAIIDKGIYRSSTSQGALYHEDLRLNFRLHLSQNEGGSSNSVYESGEGGVAGHGTHVAGIVAAGFRDPSLSIAYPNSPTSVGGGGVCWWCSLIIEKTETGTAGGPNSENSTTLNRVVSRGVV